MHSLIPFTAFGVILFQWTIVYPLAGATGLTKQHEKDIQMSNNRRNTLLDFLHAEDRRKCPGEPKIRSKRRDISFYGPIATISQTAALRLLLKVFINVIKATIRQGKPPLRPKFPKPIIYMLKDAIN